MHIVTAKEVYEIDRHAIEKVGIDKKILMENAGRAVAAKIEELLGEQTAILILAGGGDNGGDGFVIARTLLNRGFRVVVLQVVPNTKIKGAALYHKQLFRNIGGQMEYASRTGDMASLFERFEVIVDAMLGIGLKGKIRAPYDKIIDLVNQANKLTICVDVPSGVPAAEGTADFLAVQADYTVIIEEPKISAYLQNYALFYGEWEAVKIGLPRQAFDSLSVRKSWAADEFLGSIPKRERFSHKGSHGKGLVIGGSAEMPGSILMTASAALRTGAGLITVGTLPEVIPSIAARFPEATYQLLQGRKGKIIDQELDTSAYDGLAIGMGMGRSAEASAFTRKMLSETAIPVLVDADGLHHLQEDLSVLSNRKHPTILTPHPGEMAMLAGCSVKEIIDYPFTKAKQFAKSHQVYLVLKGVFTIITDPEGNQWVNTTGNAGLAKGGSGDVLSGVLLAMLMQHQNIQQALSNGCFIHGKSADLLIQKRHAQQDLLATDVVDGIADVFRTLSI